MTGRESSACDCRLAAHRLPLPRPIGSARSLEAGVRQGQSGLWGRGSHAGQEEPGREAGQCGMRKLDRFGLGSLAFPGVYSPGPEWPDRCDDFVLRGGFHGGGPGERVVHGPRTPRGTHPPLPACRPGVDASCQPLPQSDRSLVPASPTASCCSFLLCRGRWK